MDALDCERHTTETKILRDALAAAVDWWETIAGLRDAADRPMSFARDYEPTWLEAARRLTDR